MRIRPSLCAIAGILVGAFVGGVYSSAPPVGTTANATSSRPKRDARELATLAFMKLNNGVDAMDGITTSNIVLSYDVPGFAKRGEAIIEARVARLGEMRAVLWMNPETEAVYPLAGTFRPNDYHEKLSVTDEEKKAVTNLAGEEYLRLANRALYPEVPWIVVRFHLKAEVRGFAAAGDDIYDVRGEDKDGVAAVFWVNLKDRKVKVLAGLPRSADEEDQVPVGRDERAEVHDLVRKEYSRLTQSGMDPVIPLIIVRWRTASDLAELAKAGEYIYEVRLNGKEGVEAVFWVNLKEKKVKGIAGPWETGRGGL